MKYPYPTNVDLSKGSTRKAVLGVVIGDGDVDPLAHVRDVLRPGVTQGGGEGGGGHFRERRRVGGSRRRRRQ